LNTESRIAGDAEVQEYKFNSTSCRIFRKKYFMKVLSVGEFKANFSEVLKIVLAGEEVGISYGKKKEVVASLVPKSIAKKPKRKIGLLESKWNVVFGKNFSITENEFLGHIYSSSPI
jgi:antitoxin (DNA-binding transcriptional repressor) of toxin-antitoxin stability system